MVELTFIFFAGLTERVGGGSITHRFDGPLSVAQALAWLVDEFPSLREVLPKCAVFVDSVKVDDDSTVVSNDFSMEILPPYSGG